MIARGDSERDLESNASNASQLRKQVMLLADFGRLALQGLAMPDLFGAAARIAADGSEAQFSKILRFVRPEGHLLVCAGVGWSQGVVGRATVGADLASPAGFALRTGKPVISNDLGSGKRFRTPALL